MNAIENDEVKRNEGIGSTLNSVIVLSLVAGLAAIGAQAPDDQFMATTGGYGPATPVQRATATNYGVPEASKVLDRDAVADPLPPTF
jgi:hypothetical protein